MYDPANDQTVRRADPTWLLHRHLEEPRYYYFDDDYRAFEGDPG